MLRTPYVWKNQVLCGVLKTSDDFGFNSKFFFLMYETGQRYKPLLLLFKCIIIAVEATFTNRDPAVQRTVQALHITAVLCRYFHWCLQ